MCRLRLCCFLAVVLLGGIPAGASAREFRVSNAAEITAAMKTARPGDQLLMTDGVWKDAVLLFDGKGAPGQPITLRAQTPGKVILTGASRLNIGGSDLVVEGLFFRDVTTTGHVVAFRAGPGREATRCRLTQCALIDCNPADLKADSKWISLYGAENRVDHCYLAGKKNAGTTLVVWVGSQPNRHRIDHNHFGPRPPLGANGGETIRVGTSDVSMRNSHTLVEENLFDRCDGEIEIISSKSCENTYRANTFVACSGALTLRHGNRCTVEGNFFLGRGAKGAGGVRVVGEDHRILNNYFEGLTGEGGRAALSLMNGIPNSPLSGYYQVKRALVAFNTFVACRSSVVLGLTGKDAVLPPQECTFANNILVGETAPLVETRTAPTGLNWRGNFAFGADTGLPDDAGIRQVDPKLARAADGLWRPGAESPVRGAAVGEYPFVSVDIDGQARPTKKDAGCDQLENAPTRRPLTAAEVGPEWLKER